MTSAHVCCTGLLPSSRPVWTCSHDGSRIPRAGGNLQKGQTWHLQKFFPPHSKGQCKSNKVILDSRVKNGPHFLMGATVLPLMLSARLIGLFFLQCKIFHFLSKSFQLFSFITWTICCHGEFW